MASLVSLLLCIFGISCLIVAGVHGIYGMVGDSASRKTNIAAAKWMLAMSAACVFVAVAVSGIGGV